MKAISNIHFKKKSYIEPNGLKWLKKCGIEKNKENMEGTTHNDLSSVSMFSYLQ